jgi:hypothetical protein
MSKNDELNRQYIDISTFSRRFGANINYPETHKYLQRLTSYLGNSYESLEEGSMPWHFSACEDIYRRASTSLKSIIGEIDPDIVEDYFKNRKVYPVRENLSTITGAVAAGILSPEEARAIVYEI